MADKKSIFGKLLLVGLGALAVKGGISVYRRYKEWSEYEDSLTDEPLPLDIERIRKFAKEGLFTPNAEDDGQIDTVFAGAGDEAAPETAPVDAETAATAATED